MKTATSRGEPIGRLLGSGLRSFRAELFARVNAAGNTDVRLAHFQVFGAIGWRGTRLHELAARAGMTPPAMWELVEDLKRLGYVERVADPTDRRAKLIRPTRRGRRALTIALRAVAEMEAEYAAAVG